MKECNCTMRTKLVGDGCEVCNPTLALEYANERIADLDRRNAMLIDALRDCASKLESQVCRNQELPECYKDIVKQSFAVLSATSADTEAWLQAEIVKRLGEPVGYEFANPVTGHKVLHYSAAGLFTAEDGYLQELLYRLPSQLSTPEERKD